MNSRVASKSSAPKKNTPIQESGNNNNTSSVSTEGPQMDKKVNLTPKPSLSTVNVKTKAMKSDSNEGNSIQIARQRSELAKNVDEQSKELRESANGIKKSPIHIKKTRSGGGKEVSVSADGIDKRHAQTKKARFVPQKRSCEGSNASEKRPIQLRNVKSVADKALNDDGNGKKSELRKTKSETNKAVDEPADGNVENSLQLVRAKSVPSKLYDGNGESFKALGDGIVEDPIDLRKGEVEKSTVVDGSNNNLEVPTDDIKKIPIEIERKESDENSKDLVLYEEKVTTSNFTNVGQAKSTSKPEVPDDFAKGGDNEEEDLEDVVEEEVEVEMEKKSLIVKDISIAEQRPMKVVIEEKKHQHSNETSFPVSPIVKKQPPHAVNNVTIDPPRPSKTKATPVSEEFHRIPRTHSKLQSLVDLIMWKDVTKSAFVFGIGTFSIISSSYTQDLNISIISVVSYLSLVYLAAIFLFKSIVSRGGRDTYSSSQDQVVGEEEAVWLVKLVLPYVNEFLLNIKALFSGEPATTIKMAVLLFVLARCGTSITIWRMAKLGFFGVFIVPKVCSSYSTQLAAYGAFWIRRFGDAWKSCSHKKGVAFGVFALVWNLSSGVARIWAVFMLFVAFKYYQQSMMSEGWTEVNAKAEDSWQGQIERQRKERRSVRMEPRKQKKSC